MVGAKIAIADAQKDKQLMDKFIEQNLGLVKATITRLGIDITEDNFQDGCVGLLLAAKRFNPDYGAEFSSFAVPYIRGTVKRRYRDNASTDRTGAKVSRELVELYFRINKLEGKSLADSEICRRLDITPDRLNEARTAMQLRQHFDALVWTGKNGEDKQLSLYDAIPANHGFEEEITDSVFIEQLFDCLNARQALVLYWHLQGLSQEKVGEKVGITQVQVSRTLKTIIKIGKRFAEGGLRMRTPKITAEQLLDECREHGTDDEALQKIADKYGMTLGSVKQRVWKDKIKQKLRTAAEETKRQKNTYVLKPSAWEGKECTYAFRDGKLIIANKDGSQGTIAIKDFTAIINEIKELQRIREVG